MRVTNMHFDDYWLAFNYIYKGKNNVYNQRVNNTTYR